MWGSARMHFLNERSFKRERPMSGTHWLIFAVTSTTQKLLSLVVNKVLYVSSLWSTLSEDWLFSYFETPTEEHGLQQISRDFEILFFIAIGTSKPRDVTHQNFALSANSTCRRLGHLVHQDWEDRALSHLRLASMSSGYRMTWYATIKWKPTCINDSLIS